jgi:FkbM family methyltransferase
MVKHLIYDVGMYDGSDSINYLKKGFEVVAIEADPVLAEKARKKFKKYVDEKKLTVVSCGVASVNGTADFYINEKNPFWNSFDLEISSRDGLPYHTVQVQCRNFGDILKEYDVPWYLKIDIEGHDKFCITALNPDNLPQYVSFEADNHGDTELLDILYQKGYRKFQLINQNTFEPVTIPYESGYRKDKMDLKDRLYLKVMYSNNLFMRIARKLGARKIFRSLLNPSHHLTYAIGSSGPFGEDLTGTWLSYEEVKKLYVGSYKEYEQRATNKDYGYWADLHASL